MTPIDRAILEFNLSAPAWKPFRQWHQLTKDEKLGVAARAAEISEVEDKRDEEVREFAGRVATVLGLGLSTQAAEDRGDLHRNYDHKSSLLPQGYNGYFCEQQ